MASPLVNNSYQLKKFPGKGGWTYAALPEVKPDKKNPFGWIRVKGKIDSVEIKHYHLMPMGNGSLFLPVKAAIRKQLKKKEGDMVKVILYRDNDPVEIPEDLLLSLIDEPMALKIFQSFTESEKQQYIQWIDAAKKEETRIQRIVITINRTMKGMRKA